MKNKLLFYGFMLFQSFNLFSSDSQITPQTSVGMFKIELSQDFQSFKKPTNMKIFIGEDVLDAIPAQNKDIQKVLSFIHEEKIVISEDIRSVEVILGKKKIYIVYHSRFGGSLFTEYALQNQN